MKWEPKDKLYVNPYGWNSQPSREDEVEYIRKDALLEWLLAVKADPMIPMNLDRVIEKIKSM